MKEEKATLAAEVTGLVAQVAEQEKVILSLRSSEEMVQDRIEKAVTQTRLQEDDESTAIRTENERMRGVEGEWLNRNQVLDAQVRELQRQRGEDQLEMMNLRREAHSRQGA